MGKRTSFATLAAILALVQASPAAMENMAKLIAELDEPVSDNSLAPKIFRLKYVSATDIEDVLNEPSSFAIAPVFIS